MARVAWVCVAVWLACPVAASAAAAPTITTIADQTTAEDTATAALPFTIGDIETAAAGLTVSASSSSPALVPTANIVFGGKTPDPGRAELAKLGFSLTLYANAALQAAVRAAFDVLGALKRDGSLDAVADRIASFEERQRVVQKPAWDALEAKFRSPGGK